MFNLLTSNKNSNDLAIGLDEGSARSKIGWIPNKEALNKR